MEKTAQELYQERLKRVEDAIQLKVPDRVPFMPHINFFAAKYAGLDGDEAFYNPEKWTEANKKIYLDLEPDLCYVHAFPGPSLDILRCRQIKWPAPGGAGGPGLQYVEREYMKPAEYNAFLRDPSDYLLRTYLPRVFGSLEAFETLPPLASLLLYGYRLAGLSRIFASDEMFAAIESLYKAGLEAKRFHVAHAAMEREMMGLGFPRAYSATTIFVPFDVISDLFRGMRGTMLDMYRQPDKLQELMEVIFPIVFEMGVSGAEKNGVPRVYIPLHRGADGFMSLKQFETFHWPGLKKLTMALIEKGLTPCLFVEGDCGTRLEYFKEFPKGKVLALLDSTDIFRAKEVLGDTMCLAGNMPPSLLSSGTAEQVTEYTKKLIDIVGKGGGFIMSSSTVLDDANPSLVKLWAELTHEYGVYR